MMYSHIVQKDDPKGPRRVEMKDKFREQRDMKRQLGESPLPGTSPIDVAAGYDFGIPAGKLI